MTTAGQGATAGGWVSKAVIVVLLAIALGLYLRIVMFAERHSESPALPAASVQVLEGQAPDAAPATAAPAAAKSDSPELPQDQMELIKQVFAPELLR